MSQVPVEVLCSLRSLDKYSVSPEVIQEVKSINYTERLTGIIKVRYFCLDAWGLLSDRREMQPKVCEYKINHYRIYGDMPFSFDE